MSIKVTCSNCSSNFNLNDSLEGKKVRCSKCKSPIDVIKQIEPEIEEIKQIEPETEELKQNEPEIEELNDNKEENISSEFNLEDTSLKAQDEIENKEELELNIEKQKVVNKEEEEEKQEVEKIELGKLDKNDLTESLNDGLIDNPSDNDDFLEKSMDIGEEPKKAKIINKKLIIIFIIMLLLGVGIGYAYKTGLFNTNVVLNSAKEIKKEGINRGINISFTGIIKKVKKEIINTGSKMDFRNSKRIQDLNNIAGAINIKSTEGTPLQSLVIRDEKYEGKNMYVGGVKLVGGVNYFAGTPNYVALGVKPENFKDPNGEEYKIGITTLKGGVFEILAYTENGDGSKTAKLNGNYNANDILVLKSGKDYEIIGDNVIKIIPTYIDRIQRSDIINGNKVLNILPDGSEITFEQKFDKKIMFLISDTKGLISVDGSVVKNGDLK